MENIYFQVWWIKKSIKPDHIKIITLMNNEEF